jgi:hypothetical protein
MSSKTIAKFSAFVISAITAAIVLSACGLISSSFAKRPVNDNFTPPKTIGRIVNTDITEASGLTASKCQKEVFWTHNDSGDDAFIYALNSAGENLGTFRVANAQNVDWEDIAERRDTNGKCFIYLADIGDNGDKRRTYKIYRVAEPVVSNSSKGTTRKNAATTESAEVLNFDYPNAVNDAETLLVHPTSGDIYILTKSRRDPSIVYKLSPEFSSGETQKAVRVAEVKVPSIPIGLLTGGDISSDGRRVVLCDYVDGYEMALPTGVSSFDDIWEQPIERIDLGERDTGEAVAYGQDSNTIYATTEGRNAPIIEVRRK